MSVLYKHISKVSCIIVIVIGGLVLIGWTFNVNTLTNIFPNTIPMKVNTSILIDMTHSLKLNVIAEGVETKEQLGFLNALNCEEFQGFLFSKPVPSAQFSELLSKSILKKN